VATVVTPQSVLLPPGALVISAPALVLSSASPRSRKLRVLKRWALMAGGLFVVLLGFLIAPLPGPGGVPVIAVGLMLILKSSFWAKRQFIRAQYARPKWVYPFPHQRSFRACVAAFANHGNVNADRPSQAYSVPALSENQKSVGRR